VLAIPLRLLQPFRRRGGNQRPHPLHLQLLGQRPAGGWRGEGVRGGEDERVEPAQAIVFSPRGSSLGRSAGLRLSSRRDKAGRKSGAAKPKLPQEFTP